MPISALMTRYRERVELQLQLRLAHTSIEPRLQEAMRYALLNGGKRVRPALVYMVNRLLEGDIEAADPAACAIEAVHSYSLVHDDLPAMDDDDLRRGKPTCHIAFDEATAILAGDALQSFAFEILSAQQTSISSATQLQMVRTLAHAAGDRGMCAGQSYDLRNVGQPLTLEQLEQMHNHKTGAMLTAAVQLGALSAGVPRGNTFAQLTRFGDAIGLAFQVKDDILDIEADTEVLGKPQGSDLEQNKPTYPALLGLDGAKQKLAQLHTEAQDALEGLGQASQPLRQLADYIVNRDH